MPSKYDPYGIAEFRPWYREAVTFFIVRLPQYYGSLILLALLYLVLSNLLGGGLGMSNLFRDRPDVQGLIPGSYQNSPTLWTSAAIAFSSCVLLAFPAFSPYLDDYYGKLTPDRIRPINSWIFFVIGVILIYAFLAWTWLQADTSDPVEGEFLRAAVGIPLGLLAFAVAFLIGYLGRYFVHKVINPRIERYREEREIKNYDGLLSRTGPPGKQRARKQQIYDAQVRIERLILVRTVCLKLAFTVPMLVVFTSAYTIGNLIPAVATFTLILSIFLWIKIIWIFPPFLRIVIVALAAVAVSWGYRATGSSADQIAFKHDFDNIVAADGTNQYQSPIDLTKPEQFEVPPGGCALTGQMPQRVDFATSLRSWKRFQQERYGVDKPKLVFVATSGGAYRASFWTTLVLDKLVAENNSSDLRGIADAIRLIAGASGGMVGGGYFAATASPEPRLTYTPGVTRALEADILQAQTIGDGKERPYYYTTRYPVPRDSLSGVTQHLLQSDLRALLTPGYAPVDRGKVLENHWHKLAVPFTAMAGGERSGWRPSLILTPMLVETGQPLIISNLDLGFLPQVAKGEAVEMFDILPCAIDTFHVGTAVRMNASFPFVSPAVTLPFVQNRRVVDAGYYDNYGVSFLNALLSQSSADCIERTDLKNAAGQRDPFCLREWIRNETSGIVLIEIRAFGLSTEDEIGAACQQVIDGHSGSGALEFLTSPVEAVLSARSRSMVFRNEQGRRRIGQFDNALNIDRVVIANCDGGSMNWIVPPDEFAQLKAQLDAQWDEARRQLAEIWAN